MWELHKGRLLMPDGQLRPGNIQIESGKISNILLADSPPASRQPTERIDVRGCIIAPGFIDLQLNGGFGQDFTRQPATISEVAQQLPQFGVTSFLPTIITAPTGAIEDAQITLPKQRPAGGATPLGLHLEGPYINPQKKGAHPANHCRLPALAEVETWSPESGIHLVTLAPELPGASTVIRRLTDNGVLVGAGHTMATLAQAEAGFAAGIRYVTHLFNAMAPMHHREPGLAGAALANPEIAVGLIADGVHVHPTLMQMVTELAGARLSLVTDGMAALGAPAGTYILGLQQVTVKDGQARLAEGTLAGSVLTMNQALQNMKRWSNLSVSQLLNSVTQLPASLLKLPSKGRLQPTYDADLVVLNDDFEIALTIVAGEICYDGRQETD